MNNIYYYKNDEDLYYTIILIERFKLWNVSELVT